MPKLQDQSLQHFEVLEQSVINLLWATWPIISPGFVIKQEMPKIDFDSKKTVFPFFCFFLLLLFLIGTPNAKRICKKPFKNCSHEQWSVMYILIGRKMGTLFNVLIEIHL